MDDLISRQAAIEVIDAAFPVDPMKSEYTQGIACGVALAKTYVEQLPSAQPEQKKGKWIDQDEGAFYPIECSECHKEPLLDAYADYVYSDFCPNCGADMRGEQDE